MNSMISLPPLEELPGVRELFFVVPNEPLEGLRDCNKCTVCENRRLSELLDLFDTFSYILVVSGFFRNFGLDSDQLLVTKVRI